MFVLCVSERIMSSTSVTPSTAVEMVRVDEYHTKQCIAMDFPHAYLGRMRAISDDREDGH
jgi:hypothetical protein